MTPLHHTSTHGQRDPTGPTSWAGDTCPTTGTSPLGAAVPAALLGCAPRQHLKRCDITVTPSSGDLAHHLSNTSLPRLLRGDEQPEFSVMDSLPTFLQHKPARQMATRQGCVHHFSWRKWTSDTERSVGLYPGMASFFSFGV